MKLPGPAPLTFVTFLAAGLGRPVLAAEPVAPSWEKLKTLVGDWSGTFEGKPARVSYRLVSSGTALMETLDNHDSSQMVTVYHPDGAGLLATHYCSAGNQPRMRAQELRSGGLDFRFLDVTNVKSADEPQMTRLVLSFADSDHLIQEWTAKAGTSEHVSRFEFARKK